MSQQQHPTQPASVPAAQSILVIGATGRTGQACLRQFSQLQQGGEVPPEIHAFCRSPSKLDDSQDKSIVLTSTIQGDARSPDDLDRALQQSKADFVIVSLGNGDSVAKSDIRTANAKALVQVLQNRRPEEYSHVRVLVVSAMGAGDSQIKIGLGMGKLIEHYLRHVLVDHTGQEATLVAAIPNRTTIVRPTGLTDYNHGTGTGDLQEFGDHVRAPSTTTDRADLAAWVMNEALLGRHQGSIVNVSGVKQPKKQ